MYITPIEKQLVGPKEAQCREAHHCTGPPDSSWQVDVRVQTPKVSSSFWPLHVHFSATQSTLVACLHGLLGETSAVEEGESTCQVVLY